ncbi:hypothetical protein GCM10025875_05860 [Litorihabitans aurantiacus]|uniref:Acetyl-coenzyme A carboxylase carboxyl transferase subunit beta domain-containing protein n=1 Tax=Litorihabitans aurantiacus TaxID=1930061 RepID=A0AA37UHF4_9MICO|nr:hypothetical protein GCM10025875_05860 [Litorihabitans aurantiacus]
MADGADRRHGRLRCRQHPAAGALKTVADAGGDVEAERTRLVDEYNDAIVNPWEAADRGYVDAVIAPSQTRAQVTQALRALRTKRAALPAKKHGNIPL